MCKTNNIICDRNASYIFNKIWSEIVSSLGIEIFTIRYSAFLQPFCLLGAVIYNPMYLRKAYNGWSLISSHLGVYLPFLLHESVTRLLLIKDTVSTLRIDPDTLFTQFPNCPVPKAHCFAIRQYTILLHVSSSRACVIPLNLKHYDNNLSGEKRIAISNLS